MKKWALIIASGITAAAVIPANIEASNTYTVQAGDTLSKIATKFSVSLNDLRQWNSINNDRIYVGQQLIVLQQLSKTKGKLIASSSKVGETVRPTNVNIPREDMVQPNYLEHIVVKGDTLTRIAQTYGTTVALLKQWNQLKNDTIYIGQVLRIHKNKEEVVPDIEFEHEIVSDVDRQIANQLAKEQAIQGFPSAEGIALYEKVLALAHSLKGIPYLYGGNTVAGFDCSGYINYVFLNSGMKISRKSSADYFMNDTTKVTNPVPGDLVFFKNTYMAGISHMGIYLGNNEFLHAGSKGIEVSKLTYTYWKDRFVAFKRFNEVK